MNLALYQPDIPQNTGTILRMAACLGVTVEVIGPAGFDLSDRALRRAGLDYLEHVRIVRHAAFADFALAWAAKPKPANGGLSAVLTAESQLPQIQRVPCRQLPPAVVIDLDPDRAIFAPEAPGTAQPGLAARLSALRAAGLTVMWQSALGVEQVSKVYDALRRSGLDPEGVDRLLLVRQADERKHTRRLAATRDWCILAVAGDRDGDFDELFDYLRNPDYALPLAPLRGAGWFTAPPPIQPAPNATESPSQ